MVEKHGDHSGQSSDKTPIVGAGVTNNIGTGMLGSMGWIATERITRLITGILVGSWVGRYLGPEHFGRLQVALAWVGIFGVFASLGLDAILQRSFATVTPSEGRACFATAYWFRIAGATISLCGLLVLAGLEKEPELRKILFIVAWTAVQPVGAVAELWLQATGRNAVASRIQLLVLSSVTALRLVFIWKGASVNAFAFACTGEAIVGWLLFTAIGRTYHLRPDIELLTWDRSKLLLVECIPMLLSVIAAAFYQKLDLIITERLCPPTEVGCYSVAVRLSEAAYFLPVILAATVVPRLARARGKGMAAYWNVYDRYLALAVGLGVLSSCAFIVGAPLLVKALFGIKFAPAINLLRIRACALFFLSCEIARSVHLVQIGKTHITVVAHVCGMATIFLVGPALIYHYGGVGASCSMVVTMAVAGFGTCWLNIETREIGKRILRLVVSPREWVVAAQKLGAGELDL